MHPSVHAGTTPDKPALIVAETGERISYAELDRRSNRAAQLFRARGLSVGDTIALFLDNIPEFYEIAWGAQRAGLFYVCISSKLTAPEVDYIVRDSGARLVITSAALAGVAEQVAPALSGCTLFALGGPVPGWEKWEEAVAAMPDGRIADERAGHRHALFVRNDRAAQGRPRRAARGPEHRRAQCADDARAASLRPGAGHDLSQSRAALSRGAAALVDDGDAPRRHRRDDAKFRSRGRARRDRTLPDQREPMGADAFRADAEAGRGRAHARTTCRRSRSRSTPPRRAPFRSRKR